MKKEVVHVPTRELAEEVLRVAQENGLYEFTTSLDEMIRDSGFLLDISFESETYCELSEYQKNHCKIITAEEFLNRYKPKFRPIAMKCSQEQFEAVKDKLLVVGEIECLIGAFYKYKYLTNYYGKTKMCFDFIDNEISMFIYIEEVFEEWNEKTFLEYCGIEVKEEVSELNQLRKENESLKKQLKEIQDQPKIGDVCLFWDGLNKYYSLEILSEITKGKECIYRTHNNDEYANCIKATPENIQAKIKELTNK